MSTTLAFRFPLGRYHANPWDRAVNEGSTEWPPSPWRILRALIATWHTRWPDLSVATLDELLDALADPPSYRTPRMVTGHTRHYLPDLEHRKGETGHTDLTLDPFLRLDGDLLVRWDADLAADQRQALAKLAELLPYLGRSESVCEARLLDEEAEPDDANWWRPDPLGQARLLAVTRPVSRAALEVTTTDVRKRRRTMPEGTVWMNYATGNVRIGTERDQPSAEPDVTAIRFAVLGRVPIRATHGVLLADRAHEVAGDLLVKAGVPERRRHEIMGTGGARTDHAHAHWIALPDSGERGARVMYAIVWMRQGLRTDDVQALLGLRELSGRRGGYEVSGFPEVTLLFQAAGPVERVAPELCGPARRWRSRTPYLPVRHRKRETLEEYLAADVTAELRYRGLPSATVRRLDHSAGLTDRWASEFRRYRLNERLSDVRGRSALGLELQFPEPVQGPLLLGQLSHFGFGIFEPLPG